jgi:hypothetical protein
LDPNPESPRVAYKYPRGSVIPYSFTAPHHFVFLLAPRRPSDLNSGEPCHGELHASPAQASPRAKISTVEREILSAADSWSREAIPRTSGDLDSTGAPSSHRAIDGTCTGLVEEEVAVV